MNKLKTFWHSFTQSLTNPAYYSHVVRAPFTFSLKYLAVFLYFTVLIQSLIIAGAFTTIIPKLPEGIRTVINRVNTFYPADLVITVNDGTLSTNKANPYFIDVPEVKEGGDYDHLITFDTEARVDEYIDYKTVFLVTDEEIVYPTSDTGENVQYKVSPLENNVDNMTFDKNSYKEITRNIIPILQMLPRIAPFLLIALVLIVPFIWTFFIVIWNFIVIGLLAVICWAVASMCKVKLPYSKLFQMGMHAVTLPLLLVMILEFVGFHSAYLFTAAYLLWMVVILTKYKEVKA